MDETKMPPAHEPKSGPGHETTDVNVWAVGKFAIGLVAVCLISLILLLVLFKFFQGREATSVANTIEPTKVFPEPQLQRTPTVDLKAIRAGEDKLLNGYGWVDPEKGLVRIPIDQAIDVLAKRGIPARAGSTAQTAAGDVSAASGVSAPSESGQGIKPSHEGQTK